MSPPLQPSASLFARGEALHRAGRLAEASQLYGAVLRAEPQHADALHMQALILLETGRPAEGLALLDRVVRLQPENPSAHHNRAVGLDLLGRPGDAILGYDRALALQPDYPEALFNRGNSQASLGRLDSAIESYDAAIRLRPDYAEAWFNRGNRLRDAGRLEEALESFVRAGELKLDFADAHFNAGLALRALKRPEEALRYLQRAADGDPRRALHQLAWGGALLDAGRPAEALERFNTALGLDSGLADAWSGQGEALSTLGRSEDALESQRRAVGLRPSDPALWVRLGLAFKALSRLEDAVLAYDQALALKPEDHAAWFNRGNALGALGKPLEAAVSFDQALALNPCHAEGWNNRGLVLKDIQPQEAVASFDRALQLKPTFMEALNNRANAFARLGQPARALQDYDAALTLSPDAPEALEGRGLVLIELGRMQEGEASIKASIQRAPERIRAYYSLSEHHRFQRGDPYLAHLERLDPVEGQLGAEARIHRFFTLGKAYQDLQDHSRAFGAFEAGGRLKRAATPYDEEAALGLLRRAAAAFPAERLRQTAVGDPSPLPVFIVGMPRSGSTLVEQILAAHPKVAAAGEIDDFGQALNTLATVAPEALTSPEGCAALDPASLRALGAAYVERIRRLGPEALRITNKTLDHLAAVGLIHRALPNARIIVTRRDPLDVCVSAFTKLFLGDLAWSYDLGDLGRRHRAADRLMDHWAASLPKGVLLEVSYERLVEDLEGEARRLVAHVGLPWDPTCLKFYEARRPVRTASVVQVRQPLFKSSVGRWRAYRPHLGPLFEALGIQDPDAELKRDG